MAPRKRLGQLLIEMGVIDEHQLNSALGHQKQWGGKIGSVLVQKGLCKEADVVRVLSVHLGMPVVHLAEIPADPRALKLVSRQVAEKLRVFPAALNGAGRGEVLTIAMAEPSDLSIVDQIAFHTGKRIKAVLTGESEIAAAIAQHYGDLLAAKQTPPNTGAVQRYGPNATGRVAPVNVSQRPAPPQMTPPVMSPAARPPSTRPLKASTQPFGLPSTQPRQREGVAIPVSHNSANPNAFHNIQPLPKNSSPSSRPRPISSAPISNPPKPALPPLPPPQMSTPLEEIEPIDLDQIPGMPAEPAASASDALEGLEPIAAHSQELVPAENGQSASPFDPPDEMKTAAQRAQDAVASWDDAPLEPLTSAALDWDRLPSSSSSSASTAAPIAWPDESTLPAAKDTQPIAPSSSPAANPFGEARDWSSEGISAAGHEARTAAANDANDTEDYPDAHIEDSSENQPVVVSERETISQNDIPTRPIAGGREESAHDDELPADAILGTAEESESKSAAASSALDTPFEKPAVPATEEPAAEASLAAAAESTGPIATESASAPPATEATAATPAGPSVASESVAVPNIGAQTNSLSPAAPAETSSSRATGEKSASSEGAPAAEATPVSREAAPASVETSPAAADATPAAAAQSPEPFSMEPEAPAAPAPVAAAADSSSENRVEAAKETAAPAAAAIATAPIDPSIGFPDPWADLDLQESEPPRDAEPATATVSSVASAPIASEPAAVEATREATKDAAAEGAPPAASSPRAPFASDPGSTWAPDAWGDVADPLASHASPAAQPAAAESAIASETRPAPAAEIAPAGEPAAPANQGTARETFAAASAVSEANDGFDESTISGEFAVVSDGFSSDAEPLAVAAPPSDSSRAELHEPELAAPSLTAAATSGFALEDASVSQAELHDAAHSASVNEAVTEPVQTGSFAPAGRPEIEPEAPPQEFARGGSEPFSSAPEHNVHTAVTMPPPPGFSQAHAFSHGPVASPASASESIPLDDNSDPGIPGGEQYANLGGWVDPSAEPEVEGAGWLGQALTQTAPLSPYDVDTLAGVGIDPADSMGAMRLLAGLLRALAARHVIDLGELTVDLYAQRVQGIESAEAAGQEPASDEFGVPHEPVFDDDDGPVPELAEVPAPFEAAASAQPPTPQEFSEGQSEATPAQTEPNVEPGAGA